MPTSPWRPRQVRDKPVTSLLTCPRRRRLPRLPDTNGLVADLSREFFKPSRHVAMVWNPETSPWLPRNMIHVGDFLETSPWHVTRVKFWGSRRNGIWPLLWAFLSACILMKWLTYTRNNGNCCMMRIWIFEQNWLVSWFTVKDGLSRLSVNHYTTIKSLLILVQSDFWQIFNSPELLAIQKKKQLTNN